MGHRYAEIAFTGDVRSVQEKMNTRRFYEKLETGEESNAALTPVEADFIAARDSFYIASVGTDGWPYVQHRGGPPGFVRQLPDGGLGYADFRGNRQYVTLGNAAGNDRVSLFFMDYANRLRLKIFGRARVTDDLRILRQLAVPGYEGRIEHRVLIDVEAFDWNCPQHITPRFTEAEISARTAPLQARVDELESYLQLVAA